MRTTTTDTVIAAVVGAVVGGSGLTGLVFVYLRRWLDKQLSAREQADQQRKADQIRRHQIHDQWQHAAGRLLYHVHKYIVTGYHNGDLQAAWDGFQAAEQAKKDFDRELLARHEEAE